jgi:predicted secreted protein
VSRASRTRGLSMTLAVGVGILLVPAANAQTQPPQGQQPLGQQPLGQQPQGQQPLGQQPLGQQPLGQQPQAQQTPPAQAQDLQQVWQMQKLQMRARIAGAMQQLRTACNDELRNFCSTVTPGEGRLLLCMQAHEDKIGRQCELSLLETSRSIGNAVRRVENFAHTCWQDIQAHCSGSGGSVAQCMVEKRASLSAPCQAMVTAALPATSPGTAQSKVPPAHATMIGLPIYSADGMVLGQVTGLKRRSDGSLEAIEADLGSPLGLGGTSVLIGPGELRWRGDGMELQMVADQVRSVLQGQRR